MEKNNKKPVLFIGLLVIVFLTIGVTLAYYTTTDTFNNEFNTGNYSIQTQEAFVSPDNWTPGTTTTKTVIATNKGNTPAAVRIKLTPSWEDANGDTLPLTDGTNEAAIINFNSNLNSKWTYDNGYYYYNKALEENDSTTTLMESVTFNPLVNFDKTRDCDTVNGVTTCTTTFNDYAGGKYTLKIDVETAQFDKYKEIWGTNVNLKAPLSRDKVLMAYDNNNPTTFGKSIDRSKFEKIITIDNTNVPNNAIDSWDCSEAQNESVMCWYINSDNNEYYELYIGQDGGVVANPDSSDAFAGFSYVYLLDLSNFDTSLVTNMDQMFYEFASYATSFQITGINDLDTSHVISMNSTFYDTAMNTPETIVLDISNWDTSKVTDMEYMFYSFGYDAGYYNVEIDLTGWDTSKVTNMASMFAYAAGSDKYRMAFTVEGLDDWNTSSVTTMYCMFYRAGYVAYYYSIGDLSDWNVSNVTDMSYMFSMVGWDASTLDIGDLSNWDTRKVTTMYQMFSEIGYYCDEVFSIGTINVYATNIKQMFYNAYTLSGTINIYSNPTNYSQAFYGASGDPSGTEIVVNYSSTTTNIDNIIATKTYNSSNVVKGSQLD